MSLVPPSTVWSVEFGDKGIVVWAVQKALNATALKPENKVQVDSVFGDSTNAAVWRFQEKKGLDPDGVFGIQSSTEMVKALVPKAADGAGSSTTDRLIVQDLLRGLVEGESGNAIGAVNWSVAGGVDCSYTQRRVYDSALDDTPTVQRAFDAVYQLRLFASRLKEHHDIYLPRVSGVQESAWRLATLYHNYPYAAEQLSLGKWPNTYSTNEQAWVVANNVYFPDHVQVKTPLQWCQHYSLGAPEHGDPGTMTKFVSWP